MLPLSRSNHAQDAGPERLSQAAPGVNHFGQVGAEVRATRCPCAVGAWRNWRKSLT